MEDILKATNGLQKIGYKEAVAIGQRYFWPKKPCPQGHHTWHHISGGCRACNQEKINNKLREEYGSRPLMMRIDDVIEDKRLRQELEDLEMMQ